jgi:hypothetical protein
MLNRDLRPGLKNTVPLELKSAISQRTHRPFRLKKPAIKKPASTGQWTHPTARDEISGLMTLRTPFAGQKHACRANKKGDLMAALMSNQNCGAAYFFFGVFLSSDL